MSEKLWYTDAETGEVKDVKDDTDIEPINPKNANEFAMFVLCMKTGQDFMKLSEYLERMPESIGVIKHTKHIIGIEKMSVSWFKDEYKFTIDNETTWFVSDLMRHLEIRINIRDDLDVEVSCPGITNLMPVTDEFVLEKQPGCYIFRQKCDKWVFNCSEMWMFNITIKTKEPLKLPIVVELFYDNIDFTTDGIFSALQGLPAKNKVTKAGGYWQNIRLNNGNPWKSEMYKIV